MNNEYSGKLVLVVGPSGSGKGTLVSMLRADHPSFVYPASSTTRDARPGEKPGKNYNYLSLDDFKKGIEEDQFLEWAFVHDTYYYGTAKKQILDALRNGDVVVREVDMQGLKSILDFLPKENVVSVFVDVPDLQTIKKRIEARSALTADELSERLESAKQEIAEKDICDAIILNREGQLDETYKDFEEAVLRLIS